MDIASHGPDMGSKDADLEYMSAVVGNGNDRRVILELLPYGSLGSDGRLFGQMYFLVLCDLRHIPNEDDKVINRGGHIGEKSVSGSFLAFPFPTKPLFSI